jgi:uncharacterized membrane protein YgcG
LRQLLDSLSGEQRRNQELLASLAFALRSFTNLQRFLELVPLAASRLVQAEGSLLLVFHDDGRLWRDHLKATAGDRCGEVLRQIAALPDGPFRDQGGGEAVVAPTRRNSNYEYQAAPQNSTVPQYQNRTESYSAPSTNYGNSSGGSFGGGSSSGGGSSRGPR